MLGGTLLLAGHPPLDVGLAGPVALVPLLALARDLTAGSTGGRVRAGLGWGLIAGVVFFAPLLVWIQRFGVLPWVLLSLIQAATVALYVGGVVAWGSRPGRPAVAVVWWVALETIREAVPLGGFPWGILGYTQHDGGVFLPVARALGVAGVSAALAAVAACVEEAVARATGAAGGAGAERSPTRVAAPLAAAVAVVLGCLLLAGEPPAPTGDRVDIAGVQGYEGALPADGATRASVERVASVAAGQLATTRRLVTGGQGPPEVVVWPENSLDTDPRDEPVLGAIVDEAVALLDGGSLLAGVLLDGPAPGTLLNGIVQFAPDGEVVDLYEKRKLVPFGEYVPLRPLLGDLPPLRVIASDMVPGEGPNVFDVAGARIGPVTCYESVFPQVVRDQVRAGAQLLVVSTNNASFGRTAASAQHLAFSQLRAVETGRWVLHAGISGVSAVVDPEGRVTQRTGLFERAVVRADLPLVEGDTLATRLGGVVGRAAMALSALGLVVLAATRRRPAPQRPATDRSAEHGGVGATSLR